MKKITLTAAVAVFAMTSAFAQLYPPGGAHNTTATPDAAPVTINVTLSDMFDIAPSGGQTGSADLTNNWNAWNNGIIITNEADGGAYGNRFGYAVSATRGFYLNISSAGLTGGASNQSIAPEFIEYVFVADNANAPNGNWDGGAPTSSGRCSAAGTPLFTPRTHGGYDMLFSIYLRLDDASIDGDAPNDDLYSLDLQAGLYTGQVIVAGGLNL